MQYLLAKNYRPVDFAFHVVLSGWLGVVFVKTDTRIVREGPQDGNGKTQAS
jgi:hypothetical protein